MKKKILSLCLVVAMVATAVVGASMAFLTDEDSDVNVMTLGNVDIEQIELERIVQSESEAENKDNFQPFTQGQTLYPATGTDANGNIPYAIDDNGDDVLQLLPYGGAMQLWDDDGGNVMDKFVFVKNSGKTDAYVRTLIAFEGSSVGDKSDALIHPVYNGTFWEGTVVGTIELDGVTYTVAEYVYKRDDGAGAGVLRAGETTRPSLLQLYMASWAENEDVAQFGDTYDILVLSQAVQTAGFADAQTALDTAFGDVNVTNATEWFSGVAANDSYVAIPEDAVAVSNYEELVAALGNGGNIKLTADIAISAAIPSNVTATIYGQGHVLSRAEGYTGTMYSVGADSTLTTYDLTLDGAGATATGNLIATEGNGSIVLNKGTVLKNNNGAHAVSLATRGGGSLTLNGAQIINNSSDSGAIWGGGDIIVNEGSKINGNSSTGSAGAIRMVSESNLTMNGGEISNNTAAGDGGAIWGYGASTYNFNGGVMANNSATGSGGAMWTGDRSELNISGTFEMSGNTADDAGAMRLSNYTAFNMSGGKVSGNTSKNNSDCDGFYGWNPSVNISGGELVDDITIQGGLTPTVGGSGITGIVHFDLTTNHYTINLASEFGTIYFTVNETDEHFVNCNFKPAEGYTYTEGDEAKLVCLNEGYSTYWDATTGTFKLQAAN